MQTQHLSTTQTDVHQDSPFDHRRQQDAPDVRWLTYQFIEMIDGDPRYANGLDLRIVLLALERRIDTEISSLHHHLCRGLYLMAHGLHRAALSEFESALAVEEQGDQDRLLRLAREAHAFSVFRLGWERDAMNEFRGLLEQEARREADNAAHIAELLGLLQMMGADAKAIRDEQPA